MANQRIDQLNAETTPAAADVLPVYSIAGSDTKKITVKNLVQQGAALVDDASIPVAKVNLSGISGTNITAGTVAVSKLDTSTIPATGGVTVSSSNLQLVAPTSPIVRNAGTGSLEHAVSGATAGTYTKVTVDTRGHVTVGALLAGADLPVATSSVVGGVSIPAAGGLALTGGGALSHSNSVAGGASTRSGITYDLQGHIVSTAALVAADLPVATNAVKGAVIAGGGLAIDGSGIVSVNVATTTDVGGIKIGSEFGLNGSNQLLLATQASVAGGTAYPKVTVNSKGVVTAGASLTSADIPALDTTKITSGTIGVDRYGANTITGAKLANYATGKISEAFPTADYISQLYFNPLDRTLYMWDGNVYQPIGVSYGQVVFSGTYDAGTNLITSVTTEGAAIGLTVGGALTAPVTANKSHYVVVDQPGTGTAPAPAVALSPPDMLLSNGTTWILLDVSDTVTAQLASNVQVSPAGNIASTNVQSALQELDDEKLAKAGGTLTGNLALNTGIAIVYEGATTDNFETTLYVVDPTADRTILLPNVSGTVVTTGDTGTVTSTMLLDGTILNEDINASAAIVDTKLATIATALKVSNSATTAASANTASAIVARDASGNFTAGTITAALTGAASSNVLKAGDTMTGALVVPLASASTPSLTFTGDLNTGIYSPGADQLAVATSGTGRVFVAADGKVGIGTATPGALLNLSHVTASDARFSVNTVLVGSIYASASDFNVHAVANVPLTFNTNNTERLRITAAGLVGIGTSAPTSTLTVSGSARVQQASTFAGINVRNDNDSSVSTTTSFFDASNNLNIIDGHLFFEHLSTGGSNAIIATTPAGDRAVDRRVTRLSISSAGTTTLNSAASTAPFIAQIASAEVARIDSLGRVGIGTTSPAAALDVRGNAQIFNSGGGSGLEIGVGTTTSQNAFIDLVGDATFTDYGLRVIRTSGGANGDSRLEHRGTGLFSLNAIEAGAITFLTTNTERARIDSSGRLLVGTSSARGVASTNQSFLEVETNTSALGISCVRNTNDAVGGIVCLGKSRGLAVGSATVVQDSDILGEIRFAGADGTDLETMGASISAQVDGTPGANDMPGRLVFSTTADGASSPTERLRITSAGVLQIADASNITVGTTTGTKIGTATTQKLGFYNATPVVQPTAVANATTSVDVITQLNALLAKLRTLGIIAT